MIDKVQKIPRVRHADDRGYLTEILRRDDPFFEQFGQIYVSLLRKNVVKAWHAHQLQSDVFYVVLGTLKVGLWDGRPDSPTHGQYQVEVIGTEGDDAVLIVPPGVWHGYMALTEPCYALNIPTQPYNIKQPDELRKNVDELDDIWTIKFR